VTRVLIVDDEAAMRALTRAIIEGLGYEAIDATNGEEAIETFKSAAASHQPISAVIMDLALPGGMSGIETTDHLKEINSQVKVIASSGYLQQNARAAAIERGFSGILPKPFSHERLTAELRWVLTRG
jgi:CheY-like chemotaxis protein